MVRIFGRAIRRPVIGITGNDRWFSPSWFCLRLAVRFAGGRARRISVTRPADIDDIDGLIVSGGDDIHPTLYGGEPAPKVFYDVDRDRLEQLFITQALARRLPMMGICRGHQLINVVMGGTLYPDIRALRHQTLNRRGLLATKQVRLQTGSRIERITGQSRLRVNSLHFQAVDRVAHELTVVGRDRDDLVQAVEARDRQLIGVQWHPEYLCYLPAQRALFRWLVRACVT